MSNPGRPDFTGDGQANLQDFNRLAANFGQSASGATVAPQDWTDLAAAVPEPATGDVAGAVPVTCATRVGRRVRRK